MRGEKHSPALIVLTFALTFAVLSVSAEDAEQPQQPIEDQDERVLIVGIQPEFQRPFVQFLVRNQISYRFDSITRTFYIRRDPIQVLEAAKRFEVLHLIAQRGLWERKVEKKFRERWPEVEDPRICISLPTYFPEKEESDSEPIAFVLAQGLSKKDIEEAKALVASEVPGLPCRNVSVVGTTWRPGPPYEPVSKRVASAR